MRDVEVQVAVTTSPAIVFVSVTGQRDVIVEVTPTPVYAVLSGSSTVSTIVVGTSEVLD